MQVRTGFLVSAVAGRSASRLTGRILRANLIRLATPDRRRGREQTERQYGCREQKNSNRWFLESVHSLSIVVPINQLQHL